MHVHPGYLKVPELLSTFSVGYPLRTCSLENRANDENSVIYHRLVRHVFGRLSFFRTSWSDRLVSK